MRIGPPARARSRHRQPFPAYAELVRDAWPEILDQYIALADEICQDADVSGHVQVQGAGPLAAVQLRIQA
jgi:hypothetical protein